MMSTSVWKLQLRRSKVASLPPNPTLVEVHHWVQPSHCHQHDNTLRHGQLLRWMDIGACLSAEKHAKQACVTVSVDDITFEKTVSAGHIVVVKALVNRAFTTSMEVGIAVQSENPLTGEITQVCKAYSVFVAKPKDGSKIKLSPVTVSSEDENREYLLAAERRRMRTTYAKDIQRVVKSFRLKDENELNKSRSTPKRQVRVSETQVHTVEIVLPVHANHHGTTFGGQIMEWMTDVATISALRLCRSQLVLEGIESVHFRGPSYIGERASIQSSVNKVFTTRRFEVGVRVEGYAVGGDVRHINSAFFTFRPQDDSIPLPELVTDSETEEERAAHAIARHYLWLDRRAIQFEERQVMFNSENAYELILKNTSKLMTNFSLTEWETLPSSAGFELCRRESSQNLIMRVNDTLEGVNAKEAFARIADFSSRPKWDFMCKHCRAVRCLTTDDDIVHMTFRAIESGRPQKDFVLLASQRVPQEQSSGHQHYILAYSSVLYADLPELEGYERSHVISSGYILEDISDSSGSGRKCSFTYLHQIGSSVLPFIAKDLVGMSTFIQSLYGSLRKYILQMD